MIVYCSTKSGFVGDVRQNRIEDKILGLLKRQLRRSAAENEIASWRNSMQHMHTLLVHSRVPDDAGVAIEYNIPHTAKRVDFILTGLDESRKCSAVIVELKQWQEAWRTGKDGIVSTMLQGRKVETNHPSFQAWSYAALLEDFNETVRDHEIRLTPCAYLHNCGSPHEINHPFYEEHTSRAPAFLKGDTARLTAFIERFVRHGDRGELVYRIDQGRIRPSKSLADALVNMLQGNKEFLLIDDQKLVYETALALADRAERKGKQVLVVEGGPGTGKSVVAINLLVELINREKTVHYVTKNAAPRAVYQSKLSGTFRKSRIDNLFKGSGTYVDAEADDLDVLVVDEALRVAAGEFSEEQHIEACQWVRLPEPFVPKPGYFVARIHGQSMNRRVPDGSWCLFRVDSGGSREGRIVLVQHRNLQDPDNGAFTIKTYHSEKTETEEGWRHHRIILKPDSTIPGYRDIVLEPDEAVELRVIGEFVASFGQSNP